MHTACLVFSQVPMDNKNFDILNDVQEKLNLFKNIYNTNSANIDSIELYDYYHFGFGKVGFLFSTFTSIADTIWANPRNAFIEPLCEMHGLEQYTKSKDSLEYDVMTNFDFVDRVDFQHKKANNKIFHYITHVDNYTIFHLNIKLIQNYLKTFAILNNLKKNFWIILIHIKKTIQNILCLLQWLIAIINTYLSDQQNNPSCYVMDLTNFTLQSYNITVR